MLDRIRIEELITRYYYNLGGGAADSFAAYYTDDAVLDINGLVYRGRSGIDEAYRVAGRSSPARHGTFRMLLNNPLIEVTGDRATARFIWTGILNDTVNAPPRLVEQGREYDLLVKRGGEWRIQHRTIIADSGLPEVYEKSYAPRKDYDVTQAR